MGAWVRGTFYTQAWAAYAAERDSEHARHAANLASCDEAGYYD
jgi:hypothetical protein